MSRLLFLSALVGGAALLHVWVIRRATAAVLCGSGSFAEVLVSTLLVRLGAALAVLLACIVGGVRATLSALAVGWCLRTGMLVCALLEGRS